MKRYRITADMESDWTAGGAMVPSTKIEEAEDGAWVRYEDLESYLKQNRTLKEQLGIWKRKAGENQLVAGRYQYLFEEAMKSVNMIDDLFEYVYAAMHPTEIRSKVMAALDSFTEAAQQVRRSPTEEQD